MLNAMLLRQQLARIAGIAIRDEVLAKLMVLEYAHPARFQELNSWQAAEGGSPASLKRLEDWALAEGDDTGVPRTAEPSRVDEAISSNVVANSARAEHVDLRDFFWLARDRTSSTLAGVTMVSPLVRRVFEQLISDNEGEQHIGVRGASTLSRSRSADRCSNCSSSNRSAIPTRSLGRSTGAAGGREGRRGGICALRIRPKGKPQVAGTWCGFSSSSAWCG